MYANMSMRWRREESNKKPSLWNVERYDQLTDTFKVVAFALPEDEAWRRSRGGRSASLSMCGWAGPGHGNY